MWGTADPPSGFADRNRRAFARRSKTDTSSHRWKGYKAYKDIQGVYDFGGFCLAVDHVQGDPFASPSRVRAVVDLRKNGIPAEFHRNRVRSVALRDYLARVFDDRLRAIVKGRRGMGTSGLDLT